MSGDSTTTAADAQRAMMQSLDKHDRELGPEGLRRSADAIDNGSQIGRVMARTLRDRARELETRSDS